MGDSDLQPRPSDGSKIEEQGRKKDHRVRRRMCPPLCVFYFKHVWMQHRHGSPPSLQRMKQRRGREDGGMDGSPYFVPFPPLRYSVHSMSLPLWLHAGRDWGVSGARMPARGHLRIEETPGRASQRASIEGQIAPAAELPSAPSRALPGDASRFRVSGAESGRPTGSARLGKRTAATKAGKSTEECLE